MTQKEYKDTQELKTLLEEKMQARYDVTPRDIALQVEKEYKLIKKHQVARKLLDLVRLTEFAKEQALVLRCLGPLNGSMIAYLLGITNVNPLQYGLIFERWSVEEPCHLATFEVAEGSGRIFEAWIQKNTNGYTRDIIHFSDLINLSLQQICLRSLKKKGVVVDFGENFDDPLTWELLGRGDTDGILRLGDKDTQNYLKTIKPQNLLELLPAVSSFTIAPNLKDEFFEENQFFAQVITLKETHGRILYQEQLMQVLHEKAGYSYVRANEIRKMMGKRQTEKLEKELAEEFIPRCIKRGFDEAQARKLWAACLTVNGKLICKAYRLPQIISSYYAAYLKAHYLDEYETAVECIVKKNQFLYMLEDLAEEIKNSADKILRLEDSVLLEYLREVFWASKILCENINICFGEKVATESEIPDFMREQAKAFMEANPTCTIAQLQRELKAAYPMASKLWEEFSK